MLPIRTYFILASLAWLPNPCIASENTERLNLSKFEQHDGFFDFFWDDATGDVWLALDQTDEPFIYVSSLASGLGSNPVGLDRGQLGETRVVSFRRVGGRAYLIQQNLKYRATTTNQAEQRAVADSFADSILWSGEIKQTTDDHSVVQLNSFLLRDAHDCIGTLASTGQGSYSLNNDLSLVYLDRSKSFPKNTEFEVALTFCSDKPGPLANRTAADGRNVTLRQHHSFVELPDAGYRPRRHDPRVGCFNLTYSDYGVPIEQEIEQHWITRHRLIKQDANATKSPPIRPIVYYVDAGAPQPIRDALIEGASWWNEAFEQAGFESAFQVRELPDDADPMDVRYNVIQWVHRATRGWSYGQSVVDPRTGEIIKGHVLLGSLRVRQDHLLFEGLRTQPIANRSNCGTGTLFGPDPTHLAVLQEPNGPLAASSTELALARLRQLSAHEVGHTLGFAHNFAASTYGDRASVMDYPAPRVIAKNDQLDFTDAYGVGIGVWDTFTVKYAYSEFANGDEEQRLNELVASAISDRMLYISDADARPAGAAHPLANLWDNGEEPTAALKNVLDVRSIAMKQFSANVLPEGTPLAELEKAFVPVYLHHRYQVDAAVKMLGGTYYSYAVQGDNQPPMAEVPVDQQKEALEVLLTALSPDSLIIPTEILSVMPPRISSSASDRERLESNTGPLFDPATAIRTGADLVLSGVLQRERAARLSRSRQEDWNLDTVLELLAQRLCGSLSESPEESEVERIVQSTLIQRLMELATDDNASWDVRASANARLQIMNEAFSRRASTYLGTRRDHFALLQSDIERFLSRPHAEATKFHRVEAPPGSPIGSND